MALPEHHDHATDIAAMLLEQIAELEGQLDSLRAALEALEGSEAHEPKPRLKAVEHDEPSDRLSCNP